ncbi:MAG: hypothetical protein K9K32_00390 [Halanaerobiales bacterium]|nr:hypothetical protein [Halanaerobiales bacterium]
MFREILSGLLIVLLIVAGFISYLILFEIKEVKSPSVSINLSEYKQEDNLESRQLIKDLTNPFKSTINEQQEIYHKKINDTLSYIIFTNEILVNNNSILVEEYNKALKEKKDELDNLLEIYKNEIVSYSNNKIEYYSDIINKEFESSIDNLLNNYHLELKDYKNQINKEYSNQIFNLRLKLELLELSGKKRREYEEKLDVIKREKNMLINGKKAQVSFKLLLEKEKLISIKNQKINKYKETEIKSSDALIKIKAEELKQRFEQFHQKKLTNLKEEINKEELVILKKIESLYKKRQDIIKIVKDDVDKLVAQYD